MNRNFTLNNEKNIINFQLILTLYEKDLMFFLADLEI